MCDPLRHYRGAQLLYALLTVSQTLIAGAIKLNWCKLNGLLDVPRHK
jgi:hypothetical protein